jgi:hypothetical protein
VNGNGGIVFFSAAEGARFPLACSVVYKLGVFPDASRLIEHADRQDYPDAGG